MGYKDPDKQREYQRLRLADTRRQWLDAHGPCARCGRKQNLEVDHIDPQQKVDHKVWSWSKPRRDAELAKCQVLCEECHKKKSAAEKARPVPHGTDTGYTRNACRCEACKDAHRVKRKQDREKYGC